jgi:hypothetical protein
LAAGTRKGQLVSAAWMKILDELVYRYCYRKIKVCGWLLSSFKRANMWPLEKEQLLAATLAGSIAGEGSS